MPKMPNGGPELALTFDDVLLKPGLSDVMPSDVDIRTRITRDIPLNIPIIASAMDTVTEANMAIAMAQAGGIGVIHRNLEPELQAEQVRRVKRFESGMVVNPLTIGPDAKLIDALDLMKAHGISGIPVVEGGGNGRAGKLVGILTNRDVRFATDPSQPVSELMTKDRLVTVTRRRVARRGQAPAAPASHREAAGGRRQLSLRRPDHREGHREGGRQPERLQGRAGAAARRGRDHGRRQGLRPHRDADRGRRRSRGGRHRARPFAPRARRGQPHQAPLQQGAGGRRQHRDRGRRARADRRGRRLHQGRHRAGLDLHHARRSRASACRR